MKGAVRVEKMLNKRYLFLIGFFVVLCYHLPYIILGENMFVWHHDFLDSHQAYMKVMKDNGALFQLDYRFPAMCGVSTSGFDSLYLPRLLLYYLLPPYWAFVAGDMIARVTAFVGMFLLLTYKRKENKINLAAAFVCSCIFGLLQFHCGYYELSSAGIPLMIFAFWRLKDNDKVIQSLLLLIFIASMASIQLMTFFSCILIFVYNIYLWATERKIYKWLFVGLCVFGISSLAFSYNTLYCFLLSDVVSHRTEFSSIAPPSFLGFAKEAVNMTLTTQEHSGLLPTLFIIVLLLCRVWYIGFNIGNTTKRCLILIFSILIFWMLYQGAKIFLPDFTLIHTFQADRFYFWLPSLWIILLYKLSCDMINHTLKTTIIAVTCILLTSLFVFAVNPEYRMILASIRGKEPVTYKQFYDEKLFQNIKRDNGVGEKDKFAAVGLYPSILTYNNLYTLDGYFTSYPLYYKHKFRNVIAKELEKDSALSDYFDKWGSRCYIFSSELGRNYLYGKNSEIREVNNLEIDTQALRALGCSYIISAVKINNAEQLDINYINTYSTPESFWELYVYKL